MYPGYGTRGGPPTVSAAARAYSLSTLPIPDVDVGPPRQRERRSRAYEEDTEAWLSSLKQTVHRLASLNPGSPSTRAVRPLLPSASPLLSRPASSLPPPRLASPPSFGLSPRRTRTRTSTGRRRESDASSWLSTRNAGLRPEWTTPPLSVDEGDDGAPPSPESGVDDSVIQSLKRTIADQDVQLAQKTATISSLSAAHAESTKLVHLLQQERERERQAERQREQDRALEREQEATREREREHEHERDRQRLRTLEQQQRVAEKRSMGGASKAEQDLQAEQSARHRLELELKATREKLLTSQEQYHAAQTLLREQDDAINALRDKLAALKSQANALASPQRQKAPSSPVSVQTEQDVVHAVPIPVDASATQMRAALICRALDDFRTLVVTSDQEPGPGNVEILAGPPTSPGPNIYPPSLSTLDHQFSLIESKLESLRSAFTDRYASNLGQDCHVQ